MKLFILTEYICAEQDTDEVPEINTYIFYTYKDARRKMDKEYEDKVADLQSDYLLKDNEADAYSAKIYVKGMNQVVYYWKIKEVFVETDL